MNLTTVSKTESPEEFPANDDFAPELTRYIQMHYVPPPHRQIMASAPSWFIPPPYGWRHPVSGRLGWQPDPLLLAFGQYVKRGRYFACKSQQRLADEAGVQQSQISRLERALAPSMGADDLVKLANALGRDLPLGYCPHEHYCPWQPAPPPPSDPPDRHFSWMDDPGKEDPAVDRG